MTSSTTDVAIESRYDGLVSVLSTADNRPLAEFGATHGALVRSQVTEAGSAILSGFSWSDWKDLDGFVNGVVGRTLEYTERSSPRTELHPGVFTATDHPPTEEIFLHTEQSYNLNVPRYLFFFCKRNAPKGGATRLADCRSIARTLPADVVSRFDKEGYLLVRNYLPGLGLSWQEAFGTQDPAVVKKYCADNGIEVEWIEEDHVQTRQLRWNIATHPDTGIRSWFNHMTFFHVSTLQEDLREILLEDYGPWGVPTNTFHADGSELSPELVEQLHHAYRSHETDVDVRTGEVLIVDNISVAHGRAPFEPPRELLVSMSAAMSWAELRPVEKLPMPAAAVPARKA